MDTDWIEAVDGAYPTIPRDRLGDAVPACRYAPGDEVLFRQRVLGRLRALPGPGGLISQTLDAIRAPGNAGAPAIGGFSSPLEPECLDLTPRGEQPVIRGRR